MTAVFIWGGLAVCVQLAHRPSNTHVSTQLPPLTALEISWAKLDRLRIVRTVSGGGGVTAGWREVALEHWPGDYRKA